MQTYDDAVTDALAVTDDPAPLTAADRCDRCVAQAQRRYQLAAGDLIFCDHHARVYAEALANAIVVPRSL